jgi:hypothetical protein
MGLNILDNGKMDYYMAMVFSFLIPLNILDNLKMDLNSSMVGRYLLIKSMRESLMLGGVKEGV